MKKPIPIHDALFKIMRITVVQIILAAVCSVSSYGFESFSQGVLDNTISLEVEDMDIKTILNEIEKKVPVKFAYRRRLFEDRDHISVSFQNAPLRDVLNQLAGTNVSYEVVGDQIIFAPTTAHIDIGVPKALTGIITDETDAPMPGVSVLVKGTNIGTTTNVEGEFVLEATDTDVLIITFIGYIKQEISVGAQTRMRVRLIPDVQSLGEVVVVAFGEQKKQDVIGSVTTIKPSELKVPSSNLTTALAGRVAGVIAYQRSGEPGQDNADFFIRGVTSFGYKKDPLILIDGVELTTQDLARLQPDDIESFSILKDATASALYGTRAANGVILVKTKEGKTGTPIVKLRLENSISTPTRNVELADPVTYMRLQNEAVLTRDPLQPLPYSQDQIDNTVPGSGSMIYPATDWRKELMKNYTMNQRANLNVSGGGPAARYYVAGAFTQDNGILKVDKRNNFNSNIKLQTYSLRSNVNVNLSRSTELIIRLSGAFDEYKGPVYGGADMYRRVMRANPVRFPAYYPKDDEHMHVKHILFGNYDAGNYTNPYADLVRGYKEFSRSNMIAQFEIKQDLSSLIKGLTFNTMANTSRYTYFDVNRFYNPFWYQMQNYDTRSGEYNIGVINPNGGTEYLGYFEGPKTVNSVLYLQSTLNYTHQFGEKHNVNGLLVYIMREAQNANAGDLQASLPFRNLGLSGRATYSYDNRYFTEFNFGYNGTERFYSSKRFGFFPSAGVAWTASNEKFFEPLRRTINNLRFRATYGLVGNDAIGNERDRFLYLSNVNMDAANRAATFGRDFTYTRNGISVSRYSDPTITWETAHKANYAVEIGLFENVNIIAEYYTEKRNNILMTRMGTPATMGLESQPQANVGKAEASGVDLSLDMSRNFRRDFWVQGRVNFTYATSKYTAYEEPLYENEPWKSHVGYPLSQQWGLIAERLFVDDYEASNSPKQNFGEYGGGDIKFRDVNGDGQITNLDQVPIGFPDRPEIVYGFGFSVGYKRFDFSTFFQGLGRETFWIDAGATAPFIDYDPNDVYGEVGNTQLLKAYADDHWSEENRNLYALWPRLSPTLSGNNTQRSTWFMRNGAFLRLKQVELGYTVSDEKLSKLRLKNLRLYVNATNLLCWSQFKLWDIEMAGNGLGYPVQRVVNMGLNVTF
ncbi:TonB-dependent receptor [Parachryseolinea silvisoli]|uniref:TonB-dependent receptor n=1 Tax=Parachryseolinea silvisoli TaxID=2873601 RepID=UPI002265E1E2|nr:TonB-dependent receptor [Parachryseolinea silvisoli]MCD9017332.1 TonB-dependent receptor [Parachryseolinea silvisoli]